MDKLIIFNFKINKIYKFSYLIIFFFILLILLTLSEINFISVKKTTDMFFNNVFPAFFPFILFTEITLKTGVISEISNFLSFIPKIFKLSKNCALPILLGFLCGFPSGAKAVDSMVENNKITKNEALILFSFINNCSPIFILTTVGIVMLNSINTGIILLLSHFLSSVFIGITYSRLKKYTNIHKNIIHEKKQILNRYTLNNNKKSEKQQDLYRNLSNFEILQKSIVNTFVILLYILSFMIIFNIIADIFHKFFNIFIPDLYLLNSICGLFEITRGINYISNYPDCFKTILITSFLLGFSGLSILFQIKVCLKHIKISIKRIIFFKLLHGIISVLIAYILLKYTNILNMSNLSVFANVQETNYYKQISTAYIHSISLILIILSTYFLIKNEKKYIKKTKK